MTPDEKSEINNINQVLVGVLVHIENGYKNFSLCKNDKGFEEYAQAVKALLRVRVRLAKLSPVGLEVPGEMTAITEEG